MRVFHARILARGITCIPRCIPGNQLVGLDHDQRKTSPLSLETHGPGLESVPSPSGQNQEPIFRNWMFDQGIRLLG